jgi:hypothetical protein
MYRFAKNAREKSKSAMCRQKANGCSVDGFSSHPDERQAERITDENEEAIKMARMLAEKRIQKAGIIPGRQQEKRCVMCGMFFRQ